MKKLLLILISLAFIASCSNIFVKTPETATGSTENSTAIVEDEKGTVKYIRYTLRDTDENGQIIESNENSADALVVTMGEGNVIPGFEKNINGMQAGETKSFTVLPADGYGEAQIEQELNIDVIAPVFSREMNKNDVSGVSTITLNKSELNESALSQIKGKKAGDILEESDYIKVKVIENNADVISLEYTSKTNPFLGKELTVGLESEDENGKYKILAINEETVTLEITNKKSPFYGKEFVVGATATNELGEIKILEINGETVKVSAPNPQEFAGKTLHFTVKVEKVEKPNEKTTESESVIETATNIDNNQETSTGSTESTENTTTAQ